MPRWPGACLRDSRIYHELCLPERQALRAPAEGLRGGPGGLLPGLPPWLDPGDARAPLDAGGPPAGSAGDVRDPARDPAAPRAPGLTGPPPQPLTPPRPPPPTREARTPAKKQTAGPRILTPP